jgi:hypothetical protein
MSVYTAFPLPSVTYSILHGPMPGIPREEYEGTIVEMHRRVEEESLLFGDHQVKILAELSGRQAQMLRGALSQFLETPIRSDDAEIRRIFLDAFDEHRGQVSESGPWGAIASWAGFAVAPAAGPAWLKKLEANGRRSRAVLGLDAPKGSPEAYESVYVVRGGLNLDVLEHVVRDRLGIYASAHGKHIGQAAPFVVAAHNLVHASGADFWKLLPFVRAEAVLTFDKPAVPYNQFRTSLAPLIDSALTGSGAPAATLWQRKLGLGRGSEFALRILLSRCEDAPGVIDRLRSATDPPFAGEIFGSEVSLLVKELFHPRAS